MSVESWRREPTGLGGGWRWDARYDVGGRLVEDDDMWMTSGSYLYFNGKSNGAINLCHVNTYSGTHRSETVSNTFMNELVLLSRCHSTSIEFWKKIKC